MNINFELYKVFFEVANAKSISKGANRLMISQPAVTQSIQTLESELGGKLFTRTPKGVILTKEGEELYSYIKEGMNYFINGSNKFISLKNLDEGVLNIGSTTTISEYFLLPYLRKFHEKYPNIVINITNDITHNLLKSLKNGTLDIIIICKPDYEIKDLNFVHLTYLHDIFVNYKKEEINKLNDLLKNPLIVQKKPSISRGNFDKFISDNKLEYKIKMEVASHTLLSNLVENEFGIGILTKEFIKEKLNKSLFEIKTEKKIYSKDLGYIIKKDRYPTYTTNKFIEILNKGD